MTFSCCLESLTLTVTVPCSSVSWSTVTQKGMPASSERAYLLPIDPPSS